jgi:hypothetical protein
MGLEFHDPIQFYGLVVRWRDNLIFKELKREADF